MDVSEGYAQTLDYLDRMYIAYKRNNELYDFTDYPLYLLTMLKKYNEKIVNTDALFVDELQDVDDEQRQLFELVCARKKFYIGDAWQAIYFFRGADSGIFDSLDDFKRYKLTVNYRSFQEILDYADTFYVQLRERIGQRGLKVSDIDYRLPSDTICDRGKGGIVYLTDFWGETKIIGQAKIDNDQPNFFNEDDYNKKPQNTPIDTYSAGCDILSGHYFILCRTNKQVKAIQDLGYSNVSTVHQAKGLEYDNVLMVDIEAKDNEDLNIAYVAATRARNKLMVMNYNMMYRLLVLYRDKAGQLI
jgi:superfamily I DNA/RNA helicase